MTIHPEFPSLLAAKSKPPVDEPAGHYSRAAFQGGCIAAVTGILLFTATIGAHVGIATASILAVCALSSIICGCTALILRALGK